MRLRNSGGLAEQESIQEVVPSAWDRLFDREKHETREAWFVFAAFAVFYYLTADPASHNDEHIRLAWALLHGHPWVDQTPVWEQARFGGHFFILHPPLAAIVCLPFVAIIGLLTNQTMICALLGATAVALSHRLTNSWWLTVFFGVGTIFWYETTKGASWGMCLVLSCVPTFAALIAVEESSAWWVGIWAGLAALARYDLALAIPVYALWRRDWRVLAGAFPAIVCYAAFNEWRFGTLNDISLWLWYQQEPFGAKFHLGIGPFSLHYLPLNLYTALFMAPQFSEHFPWFVPTINGQALMLTSPAFVLALAAPFRERRVWLLWLCVVLTMAPPLLVYANGAEQYGARYWIEVYPFLLLLMRRTTIMGIDQLTHVLIVVSVLFVTWGLLVLRLNA